MEKKYILTDEKIEWYGHTLSRIQAVRDFANVKAGTLGGYIEAEHNLSHEGDAWVSGNGLVSDNGRVSGNGRVFDNGRVSGNGRVFDNGLVSGNGRVFGNGLVSGNGRVFGNGLVSGNGRVFGNGLVFDNGRVSGNGRVFGNGRVSGNGRVFGNGLVFDNGRVSGNGLVFGNGRVSGNGLVCKSSDIASVDGFGSEFRSTTFFRCADGLVRCQCGCFCGTIDEFRAKVRETHSNSKYAKEYMMIADLMELHFKED